MHQKHIQKRYSVPTLVSKQKYSECFKTMMTQYENLVLTYKVNYQYLLVNHCFCTDPCVFHFLLHYYHAIKFTSEPVKSN